MLEHLVEILATGEPLSIRELAGRLDTSESLVIQMLERLEQLGKLQRLESCQTETCGGCPFSSSCTPDRGGKSARTWFLPLRSAG